MTADGGLGPGTAAEKYVDLASSLERPARATSEGHLRQRLQGEPGPQRIQVEATERGEGTLNVRLRQKKHNFGELVTPFEIKVSFPRRWSR